MSGIQDFANTISKVNDFVGNKIVTPVLDPRNEYINNPNYTDTSSLGGAVYNTVQGAGNLVKGMVNLPGQIYGSITNPEKNGDIGTLATNTVKGYANYINNLAGQPITVNNGEVGLQAPSIMHAAKTAYNDPFNAGLAVVTATDLLKPKSPKIGESNTIESLPEKPEHIIPDEEVNAFNKKYTVPTKRAGASDLNLKGTSREILNHIKSGMTIDPEAAPALVTGANGLSTKLTDTIVQNTKTPIMVDDAVTAAEKILDNHKTVIDPTTRASVLEDIKRGTEASGADINNLDPNQYLVTDVNGQSSIYNKTLSASDALNYSRQLDNMANKYGRQSTYLTPNTKWEIVDNAFSKAADQVMEHINEASVKDNAVANINIPDVVNEAQKISPRYAQQIYNALTDPRHPVDMVRSTAAPFVKYQKIIDLTNDAQNSIGSKMANGVQSINPLPFSAEEGLSHMAGFPGKIIGKVLDSKMKREITPHDFSQPWTDTPSATLETPSNLPSAISNTLTKIGGYLAPKNGFDIQNQYPAKDQNLISEDISKNDQHNPNHTGIISQRGKYSIPSPQDQGLVMTIQDYTSKVNKVQEIINQEKLNNPQQAAVDQGKLDQYNTQFQTQQPLAAKYTQTNAILGQANQAVEIAKNASPSLLQFNGTFDKLKSETDPKYAQLLGSLQYLQNKTGVDLSSSKNKETLLANIDQAVAIATTDYNAMLQQQIGGNTINPNKTNINLPTQPPPLPQDNSQIGQPVNYNFDFGSAGAGLPPLR